MPIACELSRLAAAIPQAPGRRLLQDLLLREPAGRVLLERLADDRRAFRVGHQALAHRARRVDVAERRQEHPAAEFERGLHAGARAIRAHVVVELRERGEHAFHQLAGGGVVDRLGRRPQRDAQRLQERAQREVVVLVPREARQVEHDHEVDAALVRAAERQQPLQFGAVRRLRALALFLEAREDVEPFATAVVFAGAELGRETQVLGLLLRADADVDDGAGHGSAA